MSRVAAIIELIRIHGHSIEKQGEGFLEIRYDDRGARAFLRPVTRRDLGHRTVTAVDNGAAQE